MLTDNSSNIDPVIKNNDEREKKYNKECMRKKGMSIVNPWCRKRKVAIGFKLKAKCEEKVDLEAEQKRKEDLENKLANKKKKLKKKKTKFNL